MDRDGRRTAPEDITAAVVERFADCRDDRLRQIMQSLVRHLHAFVLEVRLTEEEWEQASGSSPRPVHITDERRQEFILWSDTLGLSMLVDAVNDDRPPGRPSRPCSGPFYVPGSPLRTYGDEHRRGAGRRSGLGARTGARPRRRRRSPDAELDVWQNGDNRLYAVQDADAPEDHLRGRFRTDARTGRYAFVAVRPVPYPIPARRTGRSRCWPRPAATPGGRRTST